jgi:Domain of unknown function (DUF5615)
MIGLVLDEHLSPKIAAALRRLESPIVVYSMNEWNRGRFPGWPDSEILAEAARERLTLVTYDCKTIPPLLDSWREQGKSHAGIIYVEQKSIASDNIGALVRALARLLRELGRIDWTDRQEFLHHPE